jgi:hypothetical protein
MDARGRDPDMDARGRDLRPDGGSDRLDMLLTRCDPREHRVGLRQRLEQEDEPSRRAPAPGDRRFERRT